MLHDLVQHVARRVAFDQHLHADGLKPHLRRQLFGTARAPGGGVANVTFHEDFKLGQLDVARGGHRRDAHSQAATQTRQHDFTGGRCGVFAKQVQRLVHHHGVVLADITQRPVHALHHGVDLVGAA